MRVILFGATCMVCLSVAACRTTAIAQEPAIVQSPRLDRMALDRFVGAYRLPNGHRLAVARLDSTLSFTESEHGRGGTLTPTSDSTFTAGRTLDVGSPVGIRATFFTNASGMVTRVRWSMGTGRPITATRIAHREENVSFANGAVTLAGTLVSPAGAGPHPAIVLVSGAGRALRNEFGALPHLVASHGVSVLIYDKRGVGASTGTYSDWLPMDTLASDALAAVSYLTSRADINHSRVGMLGASQGGWVVPLAASRSRHVAFIVLKSVSALPTWENNLYEVDNTLRLAGFPESNVTRAHRAGALFNTMVLTHGGATAWSALRDTLLAIRAERWVERTRLPDTLPQTPASANLRWVEREFRAGCDPRLVWERIMIPVLVMNGALDENVPGRESAAWLASTLGRIGNHDHTIVVHPSADHWGWEVSRLGQREGRSRQLGINQMVRWIAERARR